MIFKTEKIFAMLRAGLCLAIMVCIVPFGGERNVEDRCRQRAFDSDTLRCVISTGNDMYSSNGLKAGFTYEMLRHFANAQGIVADIRIADDKVNYHDSLNAGKIDIIAVNIKDTATCGCVRETAQVDKYTTWNVRADKLDALKEVNSWLGQFKKSKDYQNLRDRFYTSYDPYKRAQKDRIYRSISPYDEIIKKYASVLGWDWRMLAAVIWQESRFSISSRSARGAVGLMQVMPQTGKYYGATNLIDPEENIRAGVMHLARLQRMFDSEVSDPVEKVKFTLAAYNAGEGRIADCRNYANSQDVDSTRWDEVVKVIPAMRSTSILQEDSVKLGIFRGVETINYIERVMGTYDMLCSITQEKTI